MAISKLTWISIFFWDSRFFQFIVHDLLQPAPSTSMAHQEATAHTGLGYQHAKIC